MGSVSRFSYAERLLGKVPCVQPHSEYRLLSSTLAAQGSRSVLVHSAFVELL